MATCENADFFSFIDSHMKTREGVFRGNSKFVIQNVSSWGLTDTNGSA